MNRIDELQAEHTRRIEEIITDYAGRIDAIRVTQNERYESTIIDLTRAIEEQR